MTRWDKFVDTFFNARVMAKYLPDILQGTVLTIELALVLMLVRERGRRPVPAEMSVSIENPAPVYLIRRTVPRLRARRPFGIVQEQVGWRVRAEAHRRRGFALSLDGDPRDRQA